MKMMNNAFTVNSATSPEKLDVTVGGVVVEMLIDTGASTNVIDKNLWSKLKHDKIKGAFHSTKNSGNSVEERTERTFSRISFRNFRCTSRVCPNIPENRNKRKILLHSTIPSQPSFVRGLNCQHGCHNVPMFKTLKSEDLFCR